MTDLIVPDYEYGPLRDDTMGVDEWAEIYKDEWQWYQSAARVVGVTLPDAIEVMDDPFYRYRDQGPKAAAKEDVRELFIEIVGLGLEEGSE